MSKVKPQTSDPGENHMPSGPCSGTQDFSGQDGYDTPGDGFTTEVPLHTSDTSNPLNGSGGSCKTIDPSKVKGINP